MLLDWLKTGKGGYPFIAVKEIEAAYPAVEISFGIGGDEDSLSDLVIAEVDGHKVAAPIDDEGYINWQDWRIAA